MPKPTSRDVLYPSLRLFRPLAIAALLSAGSLRAENLVENGGFEDGAAFWWGSGMKTGGVVSENPAEGGNCLELTAGFVCQDKRKVEGGGSYKVSLRIRSNDAPEGSVYVQLSYRGNGLQPAWYGPDALDVGGHNEKVLFIAGGSKDWKEYSITVDAPTEATEMLIYLRRLPGSSGSAFFDDVKIEAAE